MTRLVRTSYHTSGDFPELSAYYSLTPVALISGKVFYRIWLVGCVSCLVEKQVRSDSNAYLAVLETAVLPIKLPTYVRFICYRISFLFSQCSDR